MRRRRRSSRRRMCVIRPIIISPMIIHILRVRMLRPSIWVIMRNIRRGGWGLPSWNGGGGCVKWIGLGRNWTCDHPLSGPDTLPLSYQSISYNTTNWTNTQQSRHTNWSLNQSSMCRGCRSTHSNTLCNAFAMFPLWRPTVAGVEVWLYVTWFLFIFTIICFLTFLDSVGHMTWLHKPSKFPYLVTLSLLCHPSILDIFPFLEVTWLFPHSILVYKPAVMGFVSLSLSPIICNDSNTLHFPTWWLCSFNLLEVLPAFPTIHKDLPKESKT